MDSVLSHHISMQLALAQANQAAKNGEVPVGAAIFSASGQWLASAQNQTISQLDASGHAEIQCIRKASARIRNYRLVGCTLFVTLEPCLMCLGAIAHARIAHVVYGAREPKSGALDSHPMTDKLPSFYSKFQVTSGVAAHQSAAMLKDFFASKR